MQGSSPEFWLIFSISIGFIGLLVYLGFFVLLYIQHHFDLSSPIDPKSSSHIGSFLSGVFDDIIKIIVVIKLRNNL